MSQTPYSNGHIKSGDVTLSYHLFGAPGGKTPMLIMHGTNYYDSEDWLGVAAALATDRQIVTWDHRGFGRSTWSRTKDYSLDAHMNDILAIIAHLGWSKPVVFGHSMSGRLAIIFAANFPDHLSRLIVADSAVEKGSPGEYTISLNNKPLMFDSIEAAMAYFAKLENTPRIAHDRARAEKALRKTDAGYLLQRDPDHRNTQSQAAGASKPKLRDVDMQEQLHKVRCPTIIIRGTRSSRFPPDVLKKLEANNPKVAWATVNSEHDMPYQAPDELVAAVRKFIEGA
jgi:esterase